MKSNRLSVPGCYFLKIYFYISSLIIFTLSFTNFLYADEQTIPLEEVIVTATKIGEAIEETTSNVTVINSRDIQKMNVPFVADVLRTVPDLNLIQNGGVGKVATVLLRGGDSTHTLVLIDGVRVNSTTTGSFDFSGIDVNDIERIEIVKGPQSIIYGSEAMAGVINIITKKGSGKPKADLAFETGSYGTFNPSLTVAGVYKTFDYRLTGGYFSTEGISAAKHGDERDGYKNASVSGKFGIKPDEKIEFEFTGRYSYDRTELDGFDFLNMQAVDDLNFIQRGNHSVVSGKGKIYLLPIWEQIITFSTFKDILKFRDPDTEYNNYEIISRMNTVDWQHNVYLSEMYTLTAGAEYRDEKGENKGNFDKSPENRALYFNNKVKLFSDNLVLNAGLRYDDHETFGDKTTYRIGMICNVKSVALRIKGSYGTGFRSPTLNELFFPFYGNTKLKPEESTAWEAGFEKDILNDRGSVSLTYFHQEYENLIQTDPLTFTASNIAEAEVKGIEINAMVKMSDNMNIKAGYTYLDTEDKETGQRLTRRPKDKFNASADFSINDLSVVADFIFVGKRFDSSVKRNLPSYSLVNLSSSYTIKKWITVFARIDNLLDNDYEEAGSYGTPGFSVYGGIRVSL
jgi:vitamin B12 transporter